MQRPTQSLMLHPSALPRQALSQAVAGLSSLLNHSRRLAEKQKRSRVHLMRVKGLSTLACAYPYD